MWDREYDKASWNGVEFNILKTVDDVGKRLHVEDMPYANVPFVEVMGSNTSPYKITAIFVGPDSLSDANAFNRALVSDPIGYLEHPFLGELNLIFKKSSSSFSSLKKGVVNLSLEFIDQGSNVDVYAPLESLKTIQKEIFEESAKDFVRQIESLSATDIASLRFEFTTALNVLRKIANQLQVPGKLLSSLHRETSDAISAISSIVNTPTAFINQIQALFKSIVTQAKSISIEQQKLSNTTQLTKAERLTTKTSLASRFLSTLINPEQTDSQAITNKSLITLIILAEMSLNTSLQNLTEDIIEQNLEIIDEEMKYIVNRIELLIKQVSSSSSHETLEQFQYLQQIKHLLVIEHQKVQRMLDNTRTVNSVSLTPVLLLAHQNEVSEKELNQLNQFPHPLFIGGKVRVPNE